MSFRVLTWYVQPGNDSLLPIKWYGPWFKIVDSWLADEDEIVNERSVDYHSKTEVEHSGWGFTEIWLN